MKTIESLTFHVPPRNQGQIVNYSYAMTDNGYVIEQRHDQSDGKISYLISKALADDEGDYWNDSPRNKRWRAMKAPELKRYGLN